MAIKRESERSALSPINLFLVFVFVNGFVCQVELDDQSLDTAITKPSVISNSIIAKKHADGLFIFEMDGQELKEQSKLLTFEQLNSRFKTYNAEDGNPIMIKIPSKILSTKVMFFPGCTVPLLFARKKMMVEVYFQKDVVIVRSDYIGIAPINSLNKEESISLDQEADYRRLKLANQTITFKDTNLNEDLYICLVCLRYGKQEEAGFGFNLSYQTMIKSFNRTIDLDDHNVVLDLYRFKNDLNLPPSSRTTLKIINLQDLTDVVFSRVSQGNLKIFVMVKNEVRDEYEKVEYKSRSDKRFFDMNQDVLEIELTNLLIEDVQSVELQVQSEKEVMRIFNMELTTFIFVCIISAIIFITLLCTVIPCLISFCKKKFGRRRRGRRRRQRRQQEEENQSINVEPIPITNLHLENSQQQSNKDEKPKGPFQIYTIDIDQLNQSNRSNENIRKEFSLIKQGLNE